MKKLTDTAETVLKKRYYLEGEDWTALCLRVAKAVASVEKEEDQAHWQNKYFTLIHYLFFLPNSPCLMNAGTELGQLSACFVLPIDDSLSGIFDAVKWGALVNKTGGGTGYSFSRLRPKEAAVCSTNGVASGPISFATVFDQATEVIKQGGRRRGANMGALLVDHPDIMEFINVKRDKSKLTNFNLSVAITDGFMRAVKTNSVYPLIDPSTDDHVSIANASEVFDAIIDAAWESGEPGILFIDAAERANPTSHLGEFETTNPCGEQWLLPFESCNLGSINLGLYVFGGDIDFGKLADDVRTAVRFLDAVIDASKFPLPEITEMTKKTRKIGLGIMGLHDALIKMEIPYASVEGRNMAAEIMSFIHETAENASIGLADEKGICPAFEENGIRRFPRNASLTSIQPTGTVSMIANCSSGCEPYFAVVNRKNVMDGESFLMVNPLFEETAKREGWYSQALMEKVAATGTVLGHAEIPMKWQEIFRCAQDISVKDHIEMQAVLQNNGVDASISKTINMPANATKEDVKNAYIMGWDLGCKGLTVYRDGCRDGQVLTVGEAKKESKPYFEFLDAGWSNPFEVGDSIEFSISPIPTGKMELPDIISAKRYRLKDNGGETIYIIVCFTESGYPVEVFAKFPFDNRVEQHERATMWATTCRLVSLSLRSGIAVEEIIKQLDRASGSMFDLPAQLSKILKGFLEKQAGVQYQGGNCPECGVGTMVYQEGCMTCNSCGSSKCS